MKIVKGLQSEIFVPGIPSSVWTPVNKELKNMNIALVTGAGIHKKEDEKFNLSGDSTFRTIPNDTPSDELMVSHGGYDNGDAKKDINSMFPIDRIGELEEEGFIKSAAPIHIGFMGGGGDQKKLKEEMAPKIINILKEEEVDGIVMTAG